MPRTQNTEAVKIRRLKKADCEVDFFFIDEVSFSLRSGVGMLSDMPEACQQFFKFFLNFTETFVPWQANEAGNNAVTICEVFRAAPPLFSPA